MKSRRSITISVQSVNATASAVRGLPSSSAISPKISPSRIRLKTAFFPLVESAVICTVPLQTANNDVPGSPFWKMVTPRSTVLGLAQELSRS